jgi:hypothetical protein
MKATLLGILVLLIVTAAGYIGLKYFYTSDAVYKTAPVTRTGELRKTNVAGSDFTHVLINSSEKSVGVASYTLNLDDYIGKQVSVTGQYSGDTLFADSVEILR